MLLPRLRRRTLRWQRSVALAVLVQATVLAVGAAPRTGASTIGTSTTGTRLLDGAMLWLERARADVPPVRIAVELHGSVLSNQADRSLLNITFGGSLRLGFRVDGGLTWGGFMFFEQNAWLATDLFRRVVPGVWNYGLGVERVWASGAIRTSLALGLSTLAYDTELHDRGTTGLFFDLKPASLRWALSPAVVFELTPIHLALVAPVLQEPKLVDVEYRASLGLEFSLR